MAIKMLASSGSPRQQRLGAVPSLYSLYKRAIPRREPHVIPTKPASVHGSQMASPPGRPVRLTGALVREIPDSATSTLGRSAEIFRTNGPLPGSSPKKKCPAVTQGTINHYSFNDY